METEKLVTILSQAPEVRRPLDLRLLVLFQFLSCAVATYLLIGFRPELYHLSLPESFWLKTFILTVALLYSSTALLKAAVPVSKATPRVPFQMAVVVLAVLLGYEWYSQGPRQVLAFFLLRNFESCLFFVTTYGVVCMLVMVSVIRYYAPSNPKKASEVLGVTSACAAALGYSFHCPVDSPTFIVVAYGIPLSLLWVSARIFLPKYLNW